MKKNPIIDYISLGLLYQMNPTQFVYDMLERIKKRGIIKMIANKEGKEYPYYGITAGEKKVIDLFKRGELNSRAWGTKNEELERKLNEGLMLPYKNFPDKYFDGKTFKEFPKSEIDKHPQWFKYEYDNNGNVIYQENSDGSWVKYEYDTDGNRIYYETSDGYWEKQEYDADENQIYYENSHGVITDNRNQIQEGLMLGYKKFPDKYFDSLTLVEFPKSEINKHPKWHKLEYDADGNEIYFENSEGKWAKWKYNAAGKQIYYENNHGYWEKREFDENGKQIFYENSDGDWEKREFDQRGNIIYYENMDGDWVKYEYDANGNETYMEDSNGIIRDNRDRIQEGLMLQYKRPKDKYFDWNTRLEIPYSAINTVDAWYKETYNDNGQLLSIRSEWGIIEKYTYDNNGNLIYWENNTGEWRKFEYDDKGNQTYYEYHDEDGTTGWSKREYDEDGNEIYYENSRGQIRDYRDQIQEGLMLPYKKHPEWRYFEVRYCFYYNEVDDSCDNWEFDYFKLPGKDIGNIDVLYGNHYELDMWEILRVARNNNVLDKYIVDSADEIIELTKDEYCEFTDCEDENKTEQTNENNMNEGLTLPKKKYIVMWYEYPTGQGAYGSGGWSKRAKHRPRPVLKTIVTSNVIFNGKSIYVDGIRKLKANVYNEDGTPIREDYYDIKFKNNMNEGLMLPHKKFPDKYFSDHTNKEISPKNLKKYRHWYKEEYDNNGKVIYLERSDGNWAKFEYDENRNVVYYENSHGYWEKYEYDNNGNEIYYEDSYGRIRNNGDQIQEGLMLPHKKKPVYQYAIVLYRDAANYKTIFMVKVPEELQEEIAVKNDYMIEEFDIKASDMWKAAGGYDDDYDHNLVEVLELIDEEKAKKILYGPSHIIYLPSEEDIIQEGLMLPYKNTQINYVSPGLSTLKRSNSGVVDAFFADKINSHIKDWGTENLRIIKYGDGWALKNYNTWLAWRDKYHNFYINHNKYSPTTNKIQAHMWRILRTIDREKVKFVDENGVYAAANQENTSRYGAYGVRDTEIWETDINPNYDTPEYQVNENRQNRILGILKKL